MRGRIIVANSNSLVRWVSGHILRNTFFFVYTGPHSASKALILLRAAQLELQYKVIPITTSMPAWGPTVAKNGNDKLQRSPSVLITHR